MKIVRIILSPLIFFFMMGGMIVIPIGIIAFFLGLMAIIEHLLFNKPIGKDMFVIMFSIFYGPYYSTKKFIKGDPTWLD